MSFTRNLILVSEQRHMDPADFHAIAAYVRERAPDIEVFVVENGSLNSRSARHASQRPSIVVCPTALDMFRPRRGREFIGRWIGKIEEMQRMQNAGLPVPRWTEITPDLKLDEKEWGPAVIVKPSFGGGNREITLMPVDEVRYQAPQEFSEDHRARIGPLIAQQFIHTGPRPVEYRVLTLLGRPLYAVKQTSIDGAPFDWPLPDAVSPRTDVSSQGRHRRIEFAYDPELLALASAVHDCMPDVATVACDIVKDAASGKLFVIEANTKGWGWRLSSRSGREQQKEANLDFYSQFDALSVAADVLIEHTHQVAE
jgi:hypothetical protein